MLGSELADWRAARAGAGVPLEEPSADEEQEAVVVVVDDVEVGGALLAYSREGDRLLCALQVLQTTLARDADDVWTALAGTLEAHARARGVDSLTTAVAPELTAALGAAGFQATMIAVAKPFDTADYSGYAADARVTLRPMDAAERHRFVAETRELLYGGMDRAGVVSRSSTRLEKLEERLLPLLDDPPPEQELLLTALLDGEPIGQAWATLVPHDGVVDFYGNTLHLFAEHRGKGLSAPFIAALSAYVDGLGVADIHARVYARDQWARKLFVSTTEGVRDVSVRKDLR